MLQFSQVAARELRPMGIGRFTITNIPTSLLLLVLLASAPRILFAGEPYEFISDVIQSLETCRIASDRIKSSNNEDLVLVMKNVRIFANEIHQADLLVAPHTKSENELIRESAGHFSTIYSSISANNEQLLSFLEDTLNNPSDATSKQGTWMRKLSENMATNEQLWRMLVYATVGTTYTLVDLNRSESGKIAYLNYHGGRTRFLKGRSPQNIRRGGNTRHEGGTITDRCISGRLMGVSC